MHSQIKVKLKRLILHNTEDHKIEMKSKKNASDYDKMLDIQTVLTNRSKIDIKVLNKYMYQKYCYDYINMR